MATGDGFDIILVGGGLQNGLIALAALHADPRRRIALVEAGVTIGGNHTWCVHPRDVPAAARVWVDPLLVHRWPEYDVQFPGFRRTLRAPYAAITSTRFAEVVLDALGRSPRSVAHLGRRATELGEHHVALDDGTTVEGDLVVDARGPDPAAYARSTGFQKFVGLELQLERPHGLERPVLMDATVPQREGFRFFYTLPFGADRLLVEDTCFARAPALDLVAARASVLEYAARFGTVGRVVREESGVLPMPWSSTPTPPRRSPLVAGYRGGWFHPATGYSVPPALRLACHLSTRPAADVFDATFARLYHGHRAQVWYAQFLNRLLFHCFAPQDAWNVFARFYTLPDDVIHRFYALSLTVLDRIRLVAGRPPRGFSLRTS